MTRAHIIALINSSVVFGTVILFGAVGEILTEKGGNLNLGVPGIMYMGGIAGLMGTFFYEKAMGANAVPIICILIAVICALIASENNIRSFKALMNAQMINFDKVNQMRHVRYFKDLTGLTQHMEKHAAILKPRFDACFAAFQELENKGLATFTRPKGGYFISLYVLEGCAKRTVSLCKEAGVVLTGAGAAYPYGIDPKDSHIRIAPTYPSSEDLKKACEVLVLCCKIAALEKLTKD